MTNYRSKIKYKYVGIDPGKSGGIACIDEDGEMKAYKCPDSSEDMAILFEVIIGDTPPSNIRLLMERVWARPTNAVRAAFSYGTNYGPVSYTHLRAHETPEHMVFRGKS